MKISLGMELTFDLSSISAAAAKLLGENVKNKVIAFYGEMGAGKTTFINELCRQMQVISNVSSPTFSIINEYVTTDNDIIYHLDLYRIKDEREAIDAGVEECFLSGMMCLVEWPEKVETLLPADTVRCKLETLQGNIRKLQIIL